MVRKMADKKRGKVKGCKMNSVVAGIDLGDRESLATVLSSIGDVTDRFPFPMNEEGYATYCMVRFRPMINQSHPLSSE
jgi:hypothetical protein